MCVHYCKTGNTSTFLLTCIVSRSFLNRFSFALVFSFSKEYKSSVSVNNFCIPYNNNNDCQAKSFRIQFKMHWVRSSAMCVRTNARKIGRKSQLCVYVFPFVFHVIFLLKFEIHRFHTYFAKYSLSDSALRWIMENNGLQLHTYLKNTKRTTAPRIINNSRLTNNKHF